MKTFPRVGAVVVSHGGGYRKTARFKGWTKKGLVLLQFGYEPGQRSRYWETTKERFMKHWTTTKWNNR